MKVVGNRRFSRAAALGPVILFLAMTFAAAETTSASSDKRRETRSALDILSVGLNLMSEKLPAHEGSTIWGLRQRLDNLMDKASKSTGDLTREFKTIEFDIVFESARAFPVDYSASSRLQSRGVYEGEKYLAVRRAQCLNGLDETLLDWENYARTLAGFGLPIDAKVEIGRLCELKAACVGDPWVDRFFERAMAFYKRVAWQRFAWATAIRGGDLEVEAMDRAVALNRSRGNRAEGYEEARKAWAAARASLKAELLTGSFERLSSSGLRFVTGAAKDYAVFERRLEALRDFFVAKDGKPLYKPGAGLWSTGRFADGGAWQGLLNSLARQSTLYQTDNVFRDSLDLWSFSFDPAGPYRFAEQKVLAASWVHSEREYVYESTVGEGKTVKQKVLWSILAPGVLAETFGPEMNLSLTTSGNGRAPDAVIGVFEGKPSLFRRGGPIPTGAMTEGWLFLSWEDGSSQYPVLVVFEHRPDALEWRDDALVARRSANVGRTGIVLPFGAALRPVNESAAWKTPPDEIVAQCRAAAPLMLAFPLTVDEFYAIDGRTVRVRNEGKTLNIEDDWKTPRHSYIPFPPAYSLALNAAAPIEVIPPLSDTKIDTKYGPYRIADGNVLEYSFPIVPMWDRIPLKPTGEDALIGELNDYLHSVWAVGNCRDQHANLIMSAAENSSWLMMDARSRDAMNFFKNDKELEAIVAAEEPAIEVYGWGTCMSLEPTIESTMGKPYWLRGWRGSRHGVRVRGDAPNMNAEMTLVGPLDYARFRGRWDLVEKYWDVMRRGYSAVPARQDWAMPCHDCLTTGFIFGVDMIVDAWRGHQAIAVMARALGRRDDEERALYLGSRTIMTLGALIHPNTRRYLARTKWMEPETWKGAFWYGFSDDSGVRCRTVSMASLKKEPGYGSPFCALCGEIGYDYPIFGAMLDFFPKSTRWWEKAYESRVPEWTTPAFFRSPETQETAWSMLRLKTWFGENRDDIRRALRSLQPEKRPPYPYLAAPYVTGYEFHQICAVLPHIVAQGDPVAVAEWDRAKLEKGEYDRKTRVASIDLTAPRAAELVLRSRLSPLSVTVNGRSLSASEYRLDTGREELFVPFVAGANAIVLAFPPFDPAAIAKPVFERQPTAKPLAWVFAPPPGKPVMAPAATGDLKVGLTAPIDISKACDMGFADETAGDRKGGTHDDGETWAFPVGPIVVRGAPFTIVDPAKNDGKSCVVLAGSAKPYFPSQVTGIPVGRRVKRLFFFHGLAYGGKTGDKPLSYVLRFAGGQTRTVPVRQNIDIGEWKSNDPTAKTLPDLPNARGGQLFPPGGRVLSGKGVSGYVMEWVCDVKESLSFAQESQKGLDKLETIDIVARGPAVPLVFGIAAELE